MGCNASHEDKGSQPRRGKRPPHAHQRMQEEDSVMMTSSTFVERGSSIISKNSYQTPFIGTSSSSNVRTRETSPIPEGSQVVQDTKTTPNKGDSSCATTSNVTMITGCSTTTTTNRQPTPVPVPLPIPAAIFSKGVAAKNGKRDNSEIKAAGKTVSDDSGHNNLRDKGEKASFTSPAKKDSKMEAVSKTSRAKEGTEDIAELNGNNEHSELSLDKKLQAEQGECEANKACYESGDDANKTVDASGDVVNKTAGEHTYDVNGQTDDNIGDMTTSDDGDMNKSDDTIGDMDKTDDAIGDENKTTVGAQSGEESPSFNGRSPSKINPTFALENNETVNS